MEKKTLGLYLHIPFCVAKFHYCDFCSFPAASAEVRHAYALALAQELRAWRAAASDHTVDTVFFGGGTPTCLKTEDLIFLATQIRELYHLAEDVEWTCEANPATVDEAKLRGMRQAGFNRISLGMQSAQEKELALLGRVHRPKDLYEAADAIRAAGFTNWNLDLMFGIPAQTVGSFARSLDEAIALSPTHLSVYSLQIEEGTPFYHNRHTLPLPDEETEEEMAALLYRKTAAAGYRRYEISNFAMPGKESRHNLRYWRMQDYLGFGIAAHSCFGGERFYNQEDLSAYLQEPCACRAKEEQLTPATREYETIMLGLRLADGIAEAEFAAAFGHGLQETYGERMQKFKDGGFLVFDGKRTRLTERGMAVSNTILAEILADM